MRITCSSYQLRGLIPNLIYSTKLDWTYPYSELFSRHMHHVLARLVQEIQEQIYSY
ncbi:hypothetical protein ECO26H__780004 [Escherichia coli O26:H11]|nr:hypothetical protein ECO26H__780004 [Escherichia coli O26:H11]